MLFGRNKIIQENRPEKLFGMDRQKFKNIQLNSKGRWRFGKGRKKERKKIRKTMVMITKKVYVPIKMVEK